MKTRNAVVEGRFYPSSKTRIFGQIKEIEDAGRYPLKDLNPVRIFGAVIPHAGHIYSGYQTVPFFQLLNLLQIFPETFIIVHPNHSGFGLPVSIEDVDVWSNSIGDIPVDRELGEAMDLPFEHQAHPREHSAEVILPFLQYYNRGQPFSILPICMLDQSHSSASRVATQARLAASKTGRNIMLLASCDFSHFLPPNEGMMSDQLVIEQVLSRDAEGVELAVRKHQVSVCGYGPVMSLMEYAASLYNDYNVEILARGHSGEVVPSREVVDYISLIIYQ